MIRSIFFVVIMMLAGTSQAEDASSCSVDLVPIQIIHGTKFGNVIKLSGTDQAYSTHVFRDFYSFVRHVTEHLTAKLAEKNLCLSSVESMESSLLQFIHLRITSAPTALMPPLAVRSSSVCRITSPWVDLVVERKPVPSVRGIFRFNERQLLADQAVLAGVQNVPLGVAMPLSDEELVHYADLEYASSEIKHRHAKKPIEQRVPPDLLWLFRRAGHDRVYPFSDLALGSTGRAMEIRAEVYTKIVTTLIDRCFESDGQDIYYNSILDIDDPALLEQYKIIESIIQMPIP